LLPLATCEEQQQVAREALNRGLRDCLDGSEACDPSQLSGAKQRDVEAISHGKKPSNRTR
jgi:hypothetical protein